MSETHALDTFDRQPLRFCKDIKPALETTLGKAWEQDLEVFYKHRPHLHPTNIAGWVLFVPWAHPHWPYYSISLIHLRTNVLEGWEPKLYLPDATHEFQLCACDPEHAPVVNAPNYILTPKNFAAQWKAGTDADACSQMRDVVIDILAGRLNPDTDALQQWIKRFNDSMIKPEYRSTMSKESEHD